MNQNAVRNGWMLGVSLIIISLVFYLISPNAFFTYASWVGFVAYIYFLYRAGVDERNEQGGYISFGEAFKVSFVALVIGSAIYWVFYYILFNFIDPSLADTQKQIAMEAMEKMSGLIGQEGYERMMEEMEKQDFGASIGRTLSSFAFSLILPGALFCLIIALIVRKKNTEGIAL